MHHNKIYCLFLLFLSRYCRRSVAFLFAVISK